MGIDIWHVQLDEILATEPIKTQPTDSEKSINELSETEKKVENFLKFHFRVTKRKINHYKNIRNSFMIFMID